MEANRRVRGCRVKSVVEAVGQCLFTRTIQKVLFPKLVSLHVAVSASLTRIRVCKADTVLPDRY